MKKIVYSLIGSVLMGAICIALAWIVGAIFGPLYQGEDESTRNFKIFIAVFLGFIVLGSGIGFKYAKKSN